MRCHVFLHEICFECFLCKQPTKNLRTVTKNLIKSKVIIPHPSVKKSNEQQHFKSITPIDRLSIQSITSSSYSTSSIKGNCSSTDHIPLHPLPHITIDKRTDHNLQQCEIVIQIKEKVRDNSDFTQWNLCDLKTKLLNKSFPGEKCQYLSF